MTTDGVFHCDYIDVFFTTACLLYVNIFKTEIEQFQSAASHLAFNIVTALVQMPKCTNSTLICHQNRIWKVIPNTLSNISLREWLSRADQLLLYILRGNNNWQQKPSQVLCAGCYIEEFSTRQIEQQRQSKICIVLYCWLTSRTVVFASGNVLQSHIKYNAVCGSLILKLPYLCIVGCHRRCMEWIVCTSTRMLCSNVLTHT